MAQNGEVFKEVNEKWKEESVIAAGNGTANKKKSIKNMVPQAEVENRINPSFNVKTAHKSCPICVLQNTLYNNDRQMPKAATAIDSFAAKAFNSRLGNK